MQDYYQQQEKAGIITLASGLAMVAAILLSATGTITLSGEQSATFRGAALPTFGIVMVAIGIR